MSESVGSLISDLVSAYFPEPGDLWDFGGTGYVCIDRVIDGWVEYHFTADEDEFGCTDGHGECAMPLNEFPDRDWKLVRLANENKIMEDE